MRLLPLDNFVTKFMLQKKISGKNSLYHTSSVSVAFEGTFGKQFIQNDGNIRFKQRIIL